jgi:hypothetical protein
MMWFIQIDIEINPLAARRHFKFLVAPDVLEVGAYKNFGNVPVPKVIGFFRRIWIGLQIKIFVRGRRTGNTVLLRRAGANLGAVLGIGACRMDSNPYRSPQRRARTTRSRQC